MRYEVGKKYPFIKVRFSPKDDVDQSRARWTFLFRPSLHKLDSITVKVMECTEHHEVPGEWDNEIKYDGFIFREHETGFDWWNQYPRAAYGQLDDSGDRRIHRSFDQFTKEELESLPREDIEVLLEHWEDALYFVTEIQRGLEKIQDFEEGEREAFTEYFNDVTKMIENSMGKKIIYKPVWEEYPELVRAVFDEPATKEETDGK